MINNGIGAGAFGLVQLADAVNPVPSSFWQAFALLALNTGMTFLWRWIREMRRARAEERGLEAKLNTLSADVNQLRQDVAALTKARRRR